MIDEAHLARQTAGDAALQHELLTLFLQQLRDMRDIVVRHPENSPTSPADLPQILHRMRGAAAAVGALDLVEAFSRAEQALNRHPFSPALRHDLRATLDTACASLAGLIAAHETAGLAKGGESR